MVHYLPHEILPGDLIAGARFALQASTCLTKKEANQYSKMVYGKNGIRAAILWFHSHGYGNVGATSGHLIPDYATVIEKGWKSIYADIDYHYKAPPEAEKKGRKGAQLRAMLTAATMAHDLAAQYSRVCADLAAKQPDETRKGELLQMAALLKRVPWEPAQTFWEGVQSLWLTHMLVISDESYPILREASPLRPTRLSAGTRQSSK